jgi:hypothetical protein
MPRLLKHLAHVVGVGRARQMDVNRLVRVPVNAQELEAEKLARILERVVTPAIVEKIRQWRCLKLLLQLK